MSDAYQCVKLTLTVMRHHGPRVDERIGIGELGVRLRPRQMFGKVMLMVLHRARETKRSLRCGLTSLQPTRRRYWTDACGCRRYTYTASVGIYPAQGPPAMHRHQRSDGSFIRPAHHAWVG